MYIQIFGQLEELSLSGMEDKALGPDLEDVTQPPQLADQLDYISSDQMIYLK